MTVKVDTKHRGNGQHSDVDLTQGSLYLFWCVWQHCVRSFVLCHDSMTGQVQGAAAR